jgi:hypothetical protein
MTDDDKERQWNLNAAKNAEIERLLGIIDKMRQECCEARGYTGDPDARAALNEAIDLADSARPETIA